MVTNISRFSSWDGTHGKYLVKEALTEKEADYLRNEALIMEAILKAISDPANAQVKTFEKKQYHNPHLRLGTWDSKMKRLIVPFLEGANAKDFFIGSTGHFDPVYRYFHAASEIVSPVSILHQLNIVHRDIKPSNYFVTKDQKIILIDLNLAYLKGAGSAAFSGGTRGFSPPEQMIKGREPQFSDDVYALGITLLQIWLGAELGTDDSSRTKKYDLLTTSPQEILDHVDFNKNPLEDILRRAIDPNPDFRYKSAVEMEAAIHERIHQLKVEKEQSRLAASSAATGMAQQKPAAAEKKYARDMPEFSLPVDLRNEKEAGVLVKSLDQNLEFISIAGMDETQIRYKVKNPFDQIAILKIPVGTKYWDFGRDAKSQIDNLIEGRKRIKGKDLLAGLQAEGVESSPYLPKLMRYYEIRIRTKSSGQPIYSNAALIAEPEGVPVQEYLQSKPEAAKNLARELVHMVFTLAKHGLALEGMESDNGTGIDARHLRMTANGRIRIADRDALQKISKEKAEEIKGADYLGRIVLKILEKVGVKKESFDFGEVFQKALGEILQRSVTEIKSPEGRSEARSAKEDEALNLEVARTLAKFTLGIFLLRTAEQWQRGEFRSEIEKFLGRGIAYAMPGGAESDPLASLGQGPFQFTQEFLSLVQQGAGYQIVEYEFLKLLMRSPADLRKQLEIYEKIQEGSAEPVAVTFLPEGITQETFMKDILKALGQKSAGIAEGPRKRELAERIALKIPVQGQSTELAMAGYAHEKQGKVAVVGLGSKAVPGLLKFAVLQEDMERAANLPVVSYYMNKILQIAHEIDPQLQADTIKQLTAKYLEGMEQAAGNVFILSKITELALRALSEHAFESAA